MHMVLYTRYLPNILHILTKFILTAGPILEMRKQKLTAVKPFC